MREVMRLCELRYVTSSDSLVARNKSSRLTCHSMRMTMVIRLENRRLMCEGVLSGCKEWVY